MSKQFALFVPNFPEQSKTPGHAIESYPRPALLNVEVEHCSAALPSVIQRNLICLFNYGWKSQGKVTQTVFKVVKYYNFGYIVTILICICLFNYLRC